MRNMMPGFMSYNTNRINYSTGTQCKLTTVWISWISCTMHSTCCTMTYSQTVVILSIAKLQEKKSIAINEAKHSIIIKSNYILMLKQKFVIIVILNCACF